MFDWFLVLDPSVQVAAIGLFGTGVAGAFAYIKVRRSPKKEEEEKVFSPKITVIRLDEADRVRLEAAFRDVIEALERLEK